MSYVSPFTGTVVQQTDVTYFELNFSEDTQLYWPLVVNPTQIPVARIMDCYALASGLFIYLPDASQGSTGTDIFMRNYGDTPFSVKDFDGNIVSTIAVGEVKYFYLSDNTSAAGVWQNITFGTGTSGADASTLAGPGLTVYGSRLATSEEVVTVSSSPTFADSDRAKVFVWTGGNGTFTLPAALTLSSGWYISFRNGGSGRLIISGQGSSNINGSSAITVNPGNSGYIVFQKATGNFFTVGVATPSNVSFSAATYDVDAVSGSTLSLVSFAPIIQTYVALTGTRTTSLNVELPGTTQIYYILNSIGTGSYDLSFQVSGSTQTPIVIPNGSAATILSDGDFLYPLTQIAVNNFYGQDGSAGAPPFTFTTDTTSGMYLLSGGVLGLTANGSNMLTLDNSNVLNPVVSTTAEFSAKLIAGGTF